VFKTTSNYILTTNITIMFEKSTFTNSGFIHLKLFGIKYCSILQFIPTKFHLNE